MIHAPEDMTVTVEAGVTLADLQAALAKARQWLPLDPPQAEQLTIGELLARNVNGPRRFGNGTVADYVIGLKVALADGRIVKSGGQVVKNVAGFDLQKLFIGSSGSLGSILEVTFKLRPLPEVERFVQQSFDSLDAAGNAIETIVASELMPVVFDLHRDAESTPFVIVLGFDGTHEDVEWQLALAATFGFHQPATLVYNQAFHADAATTRKLSVLPSKLIEALQQLGDAPFVAHAGNGIIFHRAETGGVSPAPSPAVHQLNRRVKDAFDPKHLLPELPA